MRICNKCGEKKEYFDFPIQRKGKKYESMSGYCRQCRKKQMYANLNSDITKFLSDKFHRIKCRAKKLNVDFNLDKESFIAMYYNQKGKCFYTGIKMDCRVGQGKSRNSLSVDRIKHDKGYTKYNIVLCVNRVNTIKSDMTLGELKEWIPKWYKKLNAIQEV